MIAIWDDHEFSDDSHGDVATYEDGQSDETEPDRRAAADQAWFEFMPVDYSDPPTAKLDTGYSATAAPCTGLPVPSSTTSL